jgi:hypothetical protein
MCLLILCFTLIPLIAERQAVYEENAKALCISVTEKYCKAIEDRDMSEMLMTFGMSEGQWKKGDVQSVADQMAQNDYTYHLVEVGGFNLVDNRTAHIWARVALKTRYRDYGLMIETLVLRKLGGQWRIVEVNSHDNTVFIRQP